eukprot:CAMPEP_0118940140 /NCGR_PEP_ID=MMETSP1169-20130426/30688_1 /TAXON_ID=36882 /ORGANISM="Pyramimonas obovata, Strain CCMP722" /LENGTH=226 /DNA_ID=CAMNT_0006884549 /DNA_START=70 /DNA_END=746 /DNA_ORIENTATION=+
MYRLGTCRALNSNALRHLCVATVRDTRYQYGVTSRPFLSRPLKTPARIARTVRVRAEGNDVLSLSNTIQQRLASTSAAAPGGESLDLFTVDAFTSEPFAGNPAAVVLLPGADYPSDAWMQLVGREMNLSETSFVVIQDSSSDVANAKLRWFTPTTEVDLCGHATLAAAKVLFNKVPQDKINFHTKVSGVLAVTKTANGALEMDFPAAPASPADPEKAAVLTAALSG